MTKLETKLKNLSDISIRDYSYADPAKKDLLHSRAKMLLKELAASLKLEPGSFEIRSNKGGIAASGEITLHADNLYVQVYQPCVSPRLKLQFLIRGCRGRNDYQGLRNREMDVDRSAVGTLILECRSAMRESYNAAAR